MKLFLGLDTYALSSSVMTKQAEYQQQECLIIIQTRRLAGNPSCKGYPWLSRPDDRKNMERTKGPPARLSRKRPRSKSREIPGRRDGTTSKGSRTVTISATKPATFSHLVSGDTSKLPKQHQGQQPVVYCNKKHSQISARHGEKTWISLQTFQTWSDGHKMKQ